MITYRDNPRTLTRIGRVAVFGLALLALPLLPTFAQQRGDDRQTRAALEQGADLLEKVGRAEDAKILANYLHHGIRGQTIAALKRSIELMKQTGRHEDAKLLRALARQMSSKPRHHPKGLLAALKRAAMLLEVVERHREARILWGLFKRTASTASHHGKPKTAADLEQVARKLKAAVKAGKLTEADARAKWAAYLKQASAAKAQRKKRQAKIEAYIEAVAKKLKAAVDAGEMTARDARKKYALIKKKLQAKAQQHREK